MLQIASLRIISELRVPKEVHILQMVSFGIILDHFGPKVGQMPSMKFKASPRSEFSNGFGICRIEANLTDGEPPDEHDRTGKIIRGNCSELNPNPIEKAMWPQLVASRLGAPNPLNPNIHHGRSPADGLQPGTQP